MSLPRIAWITTLCLSLAWTPIAAEELSSEEAYSLVHNLFSESRRVRASAKERLMEAGDETIAAALVEVMFFSAKGRDDANQILESLLGEKVDRTEKSHGYKGWFEVIGRREEITPKPGYLEFKAEQYSRIDPAFGQFLDPKLPRSIRPEEIIFGGVKKGGIPALGNPKRTIASEARGLEEDDIVFGVSINGEDRAYPHRILASHEMANDVVGGEAISLAFCTLCGSAIVYRTALAGGETYTFGTSGLLYRSNKLMYDHQTNTLWSQILGEPVMGRLVGSGKKLEVHPITVTTWGEWRAMHPRTTVLSFDTGFGRDYSGRTYDSYFASPELMFPVWKQDDALPGKDWVWVLEIEGVRKAYPLDLLFQEPIVHDVIGGKGIVLISDPDSKSVRVYESGEAHFVIAKRDVMIDQEGREYRLAEGSLEPVDGGPGLARVPGHQAYWFGWYAFHPDTEIYSGGLDREAGHSGE